MDCRTRINPPCVINNINHIRFITNKWGWFTFLLKPFLEFGVTLLHVPLLFVGKAPIGLLDSTLGRYFTFLFIFDLEKTFYVPSFSRNLISISRVVPLGYSFSFYETSFSLFYKKKILLEMVHCLIVFSLSICKMILLIMLCMFTLVQNDVLLMKIPLCCGTGD